MIEILLSLLWQGDFDSEDYGLKPGGLINIFVHPKTGIELTFLDGDLYDVYKPEQ